jgi:hypothetical protein
MTTAMRARLLTGLILILASGAAAAPVNSDAPAEIIAGPSQDVRAAAFARHAEARGVEARAVARCRVSAVGAVSGCQIVVDTPTNSGLGPVLLELAPQYHAKPATHAGQAGDGPVLIEFDTYRFDKPADWLRKPTASDLLAVYPVEALREGLAGQALISCLASIQGVLFDCYVQRETPPGVGFGSAAIALTPQFLMKPATLEGKPVVSVVRIPVNWEKSAAGSQGGFGVRKTVLPTLVWLAAPTYSDVAAAYPAKARASKAAGRATLYCNFVSDGRLTACDVVAEEPRGMGFGAAARKLAPLFRSPTELGDGKGLIGASLQLPFTFDPTMLGPGQAAVGKPQWKGLPAFEDVQTAFASTPKNVGTVRVVLSCTVQQGGYVSECKPDTQSPAGQGFGAAAVALAAKFRLSTWSNDGLPVVGGTVRIPIRYESDEAKSSAEPAKP